MRLSKRCRKAWPTAVACAVGALSAVPAWAQSETTNTVVVVGDALSGRTFDVPASVDVVEGEAMRKQQATVNLSEALSRVPGLVIQNRQNLAQDLQLSSRGFGARATFGVRGVRLLQDGIPLTMPDGAGQTALFDLEGASHVEVLRGPFAALYGNSSGGVVHLFTADGAGPPTVDLSAMAGSHDSWRAGVRVSGKAGAVAYALNASRYRTDGYRDHSAAVRDIANARLRWTGDDGSTLTVLANVLEQPDTQDPLGLTREQLEADRRQHGSNAKLFNTRKSIEHRQAGVVYRHRLGAGSHLQAMAYGGERRVEQYLAIPVAAQGATSSGGIVDLDRRFGGLGLQWRHGTALLGRPLHFTLGASHDTMSELRTGYVNNNGVKGALRRDETDRVRSADAFVLADWQLTERLRLAGGVRHSDVRFRATDRFITALNPDDSGRASYRRASPVLGATYRLGRDTSVYASVGSGFETPTFVELAYRPGGQTGLNFDLDPAVSRNVEAGIKTTVAPGVRTAAALFRSETRDDIVSAGSSGGRTVFANAGRTRREGLELSVDAALGHAWSAYAAYTHTRAQYRELITGAGADLSGAKVPGVPAHVLHAELAWSHERSGWSSALEWHATSRVYANDTNSAAAAGYGSVNWRAGWATRADAWRLEVFARVDNLLDKAYVGSVIVNEANLRYFEPAPGRTLMLGARATLSF